MFRGAECTIIATFSAVLTEMADRVRLHAVLGSQLRRLLASAVRPADTGRIHVTGPNPLRILLVGAGLAPGYGVEERQDALDGALAPHLAAVTGRGVTVDHRTRPELRMADTVALLGEVGAHTYEVVIWCPTFTELPYTASFARWGAQLSAVIDRLETTRSPQTRLVLLGLPPLEGSPRLERLSDGWMGRINARIRATAERATMASYLQPPPVTVRHPRDLPFNAGYYSTCAQRLTEHLRPRLHPATGPNTSGPTCSEGSPSCGPSR